MWSDEKWILTALSCNLHIMSKLFLAERERERESCLFDKTHDAIINMHNVHKYKYASLDHEIQKGCILGVSSPRKLENFHWYLELGPLSRVYKTGVCQSQKWCSFV